LRGRRAGACQLEGCSNVKYQLGTSSEDDVDERFFERRKLSFVRS
jgi:hypothetical protein